MNQVVHHPKKHCFTIDLDGQLAKLEYRLLDEHTVEFTSTHVPFNLRGRGFGAELVRAGLEWAHKHHFNIESRCWFFDRFLQNKMVSPN